MALYAFTRCTCPSLCKCSRFALCTSETTAPQTTVFRNEVLDACDKGGGTLPERDPAACKGTLRPPPPNVNIRLGGGGGVGTRLRPKRGGGGVRDLLERGGGGGGEGVQGRGRRGSRGGGEGVQGSPPTCRNEN